VPLIADRYETLERIGGGGMADVFRAHDRTLDRDVAVKLMRPAFARDPEFAQRFHREAEALGAIDHPNIVGVLDYGASAEGPFIVMELVSGGTLRDLIRARGRVDQYAAARMAAAIADGLEAAHLRGVLHRDLKPDNVLLDGAGRPKIADFGIARLAAATAITRTGEVLGTPQYLAPEQMTGDVVDERADVYALGVILYEMLTGEQPTGGVTPSEIVSRRLRVDPRPPSRLVALAPRINALVLRALARDPARRIRRAADLRAELLAIRPPEPRAPARTRVAGPRLRSVRVPGPRLPSAAPITIALASLAASISDFGRRVGRSIEAGGARLCGLLVASRRRSLAPLMAALALLAAFIGGSVVLGGARPVAVAPEAVATATPPAAVLASTSSPAPSTPPIATAAPTAEPTTEPTPAPTVKPAPTPAVAATVGGDPAGTIVSFYQLISGEDYASASGLWSERMRAAYPPQTNIWGRFDSTSSIVARSAWVTSATPGSAAVAVDLVETMRNGSVRHWVGTWYLVRSGSGWLLDQPGLRPG
jgi:tRNA A-37 threonylcarbamoyl transferase component Bud32